MFDKLLISQLYRVECDNVTAFLNESLITIELAVGVARIQTNGDLVCAHVLGIVCVSWNVW